MTPSGIEPANFRFVAQRLNHCTTAVPFNFIIQRFIGLHRYLIYDIQFYISRYSLNLKASWNNVHAFSCGIYSSPVSCHPHTFKFLRNSVTFLVVSSKFDCLVTEFGTFLRHNTAIISIHNICYTGHLFKTLLLISPLPHADFEGRNLGKPLTCIKTRRYRVPHNESLSIHRAVGWRRVTWAPALLSYIPRLACKCGTFPLFATLFCRDGYLLLYSSINIDTKKDDVRLCIKSHDCG